MEWSKRSLGIASGYLVRSFFTSAIGDVDDLELFLIQLAFLLEVLHDAVKSIVIICHNNDCIVDLMEEPALPESIGICVD